MKYACIAAAMALHFAAFRTKAQTALAWEKREAPTIVSVADALDRIATAFEEYKKVNDQRLAEIKKGNATGDMDAKLARMDEHMASLAEAKTRLEKVETKLARPGALGGGNTAQNNGETPEAAEYRATFLDWMRAPTDHDRQVRTSQAFKVLEAKNRSADGRQTRSAQTVTTTGSAGGFALPEVIERSIQRLSVDISPIRGIATVRTVGSSDYKELFDVNGAAFEWVGETDARSQTNSPDLAEVAPTFGMASAKPQASEESMDDLFFDVENWLIMSAAEAMSAGEGAAYVAGNGSKKPTGFLAGPAPLATADATRAFGTLQYIPSGQAAAMPTSHDVFYDMIYGLRARYRANAQWVTSKLQLAAMRKYKDSTGAYLWQPNLIVGQPSTFMGYGITEAEDMPIVAANAFPIAFGDFREGYLIADRVGLRITRDEITTPGFVKFYVRRRTGGKLRNTQAIKLLKIAVS